METVAERAKGGGEKDKEGRDGLGKRRAHARVGESMSTRRGRERERSIEREKTREGKHEWDILHWGRQVLHLMSLRVGCTL